MNLLADRLKYAMARTDPPTRAVDLRRWTGVSKATASDWLSGKTKDMLSYKMAIIAAKLGVSFYWLATGRGKMELTEVNDTPANYSDQVPNEAKLRKATQFILEHIDYKDLQRYGSDWTASAIVMLYDLFNDPASHQLDDLTLVKLLQSLSKEKQ